MNIESNSLQNKCYIKKLIDSYINNKDSYQYYNENNETRLIIPISLQNDTFQEVLIETQDLENTTFFINIIAMGNIYEDIEEIIFYNEQTYKYERPSEEN